MQGSKKDAILDSTVVLRVRDLSFSYNKAPVLDRISLDLALGQIAVLAGRNGSGKTTLMRCLAGWSPYKSGSITLCGKRFDGSRREQRGQIFFVNDTPAFYDDLTAEEHMRFILSVNHRVDLMPTADEYLRRFDLSAHRNQLPSSYSRGMRLRLALCIAFTLRPPLLLLDEPFGPLDPEAAKLLCTELKAVAQKGSAVLLSLHQQIEGLKADVYWTLEDHELVRTGINPA